MTAPPRSPGRRSRCLLTSSAGPGSAPTGPGRRAAQPGASAPGWHASDQIIPVAALADGTSRFQVPFLTGHAETAAWLAWLFLRAEVRATGSTLVIHGQGARSLGMDTCGENDPPAPVLSYLR